MKIQATVATAPKLALVTGLAKVKAPVAKAPVFIDRQDPPEAKEAAARLVDEQLAMAEATAEPTFWQKYKTHIIIGAGALVALGIFLRK